MRVVCNNVGFDGVSAALRIRRAFIHSYVVSVFKVASENLSLLGQ
jgi:hypothetical protein